MQTSLREQQKHPSRTAVSSASIVSTLPGTESTEHRIPPPQCDLSCCLFLLRGGGMVSALCCWDSASRVTLSSQLYPKEEWQRQGLPGLPALSCTHLNVTCRRILATTAVTVRMRRVARPYTVHPASAKRAHQICLYFPKETGSAGGSVHSAGGSSQQTWQWSNRSWAEHGTFVWLCLVLKLPL